MKPLIYARPHKHTIVREERHLLQSIENSLQAAKVKYTNDQFASFDVAHFVDCADIKKVSDIKRSGIPVVISALYCENERSSSMVEFKSNNKRVLKDKVRKCLNVADLVLVSGEMNKQFLEKQGVLAKIKVFPLPVDVKRFLTNTKKDKQIYSSYFKDHNDKKFILCIGNYLNEEDMSRLIEVAELAPFAKFYFIGANYSVLLAGKYKKLAPKNVILSTFVEEDVYQATIKNAKILLVLNENKVEAINVIEAMAAKTQVVAYLKDIKEDSNLQDGVNCYLKKGINEVVDTIDQLLKGKLRETTKKAYQYALNYNLDKCGKRLANIYRALIKEAQHD